MQQKPHREEQDFARCPEPHRHGGNRIRPHIEGGTGDWGWLRIVWITRIGRLAAVAYPHNQQKSAQSAQSVAKKLSAFEDVRVGDSQSWAANQSCRRTNSIPRAPAAARPRSSAKNFRSASLPCRAAVPSLQFRHRNRNRYRLLFFRNA